MKYKDGENIMNIVVKNISGTKKKIASDGGWIHERLFQSPHHNH